MFMTSNKKISESATPHKMNHDFHIVFLFCFVESLKENVLIFMEHFWDKHIFTKPPGALIKEATCLSLS